MQLHELKSPKGSRKVKRIKGRGPGSGRGKTSGRGENGQNSRPGRSSLPGSEGGQMPLIRRIPKVGFRSHRPIVYQTVKIGDLARFKKGDVVDVKVLREVGLISSIYKPVKILANGELEKSLTVKATAFSKSAIEKIEKAGGKTEIFDKSELKKDTEKK
jgi:large subunit ribosomal protein L15